MELQSIREQVDTLRKLDPHHRVFGANQHRYHFADPIDHKVLAGFESAHAITLPSDYRQYLTGLSNGGVGPNYGLKDFSHASRGHSPGKRFPSVGEPYRRQRGSFDYCNVPGTLWLSDNGCATSDVLVVNGPSYGSVWTILNEEDYCCCKSFEDWYLGWVSSAINTIRRESILSRFRVGMHLDEIREHLGQEIVPVANEKKTDGYSLCFHDCNAHFFFDQHDRLLRFDHYSHIICPQI